MANPNHVMAGLIAKRGRAVGAPVDGTEYKLPLLGVDRSGHGSALAVVIASLNITTVAGDGTSSIEVTVQHSATTTDGDFETLKAKVTKSIVAATTGVAEVCMAVPVNLAAAKKYIRVLVKTVSGDNSFTTTIPHSLSAVILLGGSVVKPDAAYNKDAYYDDDVSDIA